eukprot:CAMPEP_0117418382 /NCGR_PEP_ID=MMETSP0758-20121206/177_1 /TAXON_ID=63605 /ORGANISM="Percolomonas cosmopolitus, Strain AE-1 (ATCC 50343)" /LENGTH=207 /DNA_ID=CAMNT_0005198857 /DNA_START=447 /DNA_END=1068 /DNA_ORIENTATION=-
MYASWIPQSGEIPDLYIEPQHSRVLEVKAYQITETEKFKMGYTLRFPRVKAIRYDKALDDVFTITEMNDYIKMNKANTQHENDHPWIRLKMNAILKENEGVMLRLNPNMVIDHFQDTDTSFIPIVNHLFKGLEMVVLNANQPPHKVTKSYIESLIYQHGGKKVQNPTRHTSMLIAAKKDQIRVKTWIESCEKGENMYGDKDIVHVSW